MKIKCRPEDFQVEEIIRLRLKNQGRYSIYRLEKKYWNTLDVIRDLQIRHQLHGFSRAGLKDRYSLSVQYLSLPGRGPERIDATNYHLVRIGMADEPVKPEQLLANRFLITIRGLDSAELEVLEQTVPAVKRFGVANYYDVQRFGSARHRAGFIARKLIDGHYNGALKLFLATPSPNDDSRTRRIKQYLGQNWGNWQRCLETVPYEGRRAIRHLIQYPRDFEGAVKLLPKTYLELFINAYQSWLWNEVLRLLLEEMGVVRLRVKYNLGVMSFFENLTGEEARYLRQLLIPTPGPKAEFVSERVARAVNSVLEKEGLELRDLKLKFRIKGVHFKSWMRPALFFPDKLAVSAAEKDELYAEKQKVQLAFELPAGCYATVLLKRLFAR